MIAEECKKLREQLEEVKKADDRRNVVKELDRRRDELVPLRDAILAVCSLLKTIASRTSIEGGLDPAKAIDRVQKIREALKADPLSITEGRNFSSMEKAFQTFAKDATIAAQAAWDRYVVKVQPSVDTVRLTRAERLKGSAIIASRIKDRANYVQGLAKKPPASERDILSIEAAWDDIRQMMSDLPNVAEDPIVQEFLEAAESTGGASLDLLTADVRTWLHENNIAGKYRIKAI
jgi:hypothetical protein